MKSSYVIQLLKFCKWFSTIAALVEIHLMSWLGLHSWNFFTTVFTKMILFIMLFNFCGIFKHVMAYITFLMFLSNMLWHLRMMIEDFFTFCAFKVPFLYMFFFDFNICEFNTGTKLAYMVFCSVRPKPNGSAEHSAEIDRTGSAERSVNLTEPRTSHFDGKNWPFSRKIAIFWEKYWISMKLIFIPNNL